MIDRQQALVSASAGGASRGRALGRMPMYEGQDQVNYSQVNRLAREMFVQVKHLAPDWNVESTDTDTREGRVDLPRVISDLIGNKKTTFTKVLRSADENTDEGRNVWERVTEVFYYFIMRFVVGLYTKVS
eukprot:scaffold133089_cov96-Cyclotella_meneghiniana.AAC.1